MKTIDRPTRARTTAWRCRGMTISVAVLTLCAGFPSSSQARSPFLRRSTPTVSDAPVSCCGHPAAAPALAAQVLAGSAAQLTTYQCPVFRMSQVGDLWMYYSCQWTPMGCGPNPQPLYLSNANAQGCPSSDPASTTGHNCVQVGGGEFRTKAADDGCKFGYSGDLPTFDPAIYETLDKFTGMYEHQSQKLQIRFFKLKLKANGFVFGVGFEDVCGTFDKRDEPIVCCGKGGKKGFSVTIDSLPYRVLLHRDSKSKCKED